MSLWRQLTHGARVLLRRDRADADLDEELQQFVSEASSDWTAGDVLRAREQVREAGWEEGVGVTLADARYAVRRLRRDVAFTSAAVTTLALGIGATTAIFSAVNPVLFRPLPYPSSDRLVAIADRRPDGAPLDVTFGTFREISARSDAFDAITVFKPWQPAWTADGPPERLIGQRVSAAYFHVFGVRPALGVDFDAADDRPGGANVLVISDGLWHRRFAADPGAIGRHIRLDGVSHTIVGIMPKGFQVVQAPNVDAWSLLQYDPALPPDGREWGHHLRAVARLRPRVGIDAAMAQLDAIAARPSPSFRRMPWASLAQGFSVNALRDEVVRGVRPALVAVMAAVLLVLIAACVNVTNLLLARGTQRGGEMAVRTALGAGRARLVRQLVTESVVVALVGGLGGVIVATIGVRALVALAPAALPRIQEIRLDATALLFALAVSTVAGVLVGVVPAWQTSVEDPRRMLPLSSRTMAAPQAAKNVLVVIEVAVALVLLVVAGLLLRSLNRLFAIDPGFSSAHVLTLQVDASALARDRNATRPFFERALERVRQLPGVQTAGWTSQLPLSDDFDKYGAALEDPPDRDAAADHSALRYAVTPGYFDAMGIRARRGRLIDDGDRDGRAVSVVVSESFVRHRFGTADPIGRHLHLGRTDLPWYTLVGVVGDVKQASLAIDEGDAVYVAEEQWYYADTVRSLVVRTAGDPAAGTASVQRAIWSVEPDVPIVRVGTLDALVAASAAARRFALLVFECFALVSLTLAATGLYGVIAGSVAGRVGELGIRAALGATRASLLTLVLREGMALTAAGIIIGLTVATAASGAIRSMLFGISPVDAGTYLAVVALVGIVAAVACALPAWRAAHVDPAAMLR
jgi:putative ABC transport system permease protein